MESSVESASIERVSLYRFRNFEELELALGEGIHILVGPNAQGKTNFLEALYLSASTRLLRGQRDVEAISEGFDSAQVTVHLRHSGTTISVALDRSSRKKVLLNGLSLPRAADALGRLPCICICSADLALVQGEPSDRRLFLDLELSQLYPAYLRHLSVYKRALDQRNAALKAAQTNHVPDEMFEAWEAQLSQHGAELRAFRRRFVSNLIPYAQAAHVHMGSGERIELRYSARDEAESESDLARIYAESRGADITRGTSSAGPHRDDFHIAVGGREARLFGSQGQQRTSMLSIKLGTMEMERGERGFTPLLLLDDILSDLDEGRRARLMDWVLENAAQTVLTCTEVAAAGSKILTHAAIYTVKEGTIQPS